MMTLSRRTRLIISCAALVVPASVVLSLFAFSLGPAWVYQWFWVDYEMFTTQWAFKPNVPAAASTLFLWSAGTVWLVLAFQHRLGKPAWTLTFGAFLIFMGIDEALWLHERLEKFLQLDWQLLYLPMMAFGGLAWLAMMLRLEGDLKPARLALAVGSLLWVISQILEFLQWKGNVPQPGFRAYVVAEEILESWGTLAFLLAGLLVRRLTAQRQDVARR